MIYILCCLCVCVSVCVLFGDEEVRAFIEESSCYCISVFGCRSCLCLFVLLVAPRTFLVLVVVLFLLGICSIHFRYLSLSISIFCSLFRQFWSMSYEAIVSRWLWVSSSILVSVHVRVLVWFRWYKVVWISFDHSTTSSLWFLSRFDYTGLLSKSVKYFMMCQSNMMVMVMVNGWCLSNRSLV